MVGVKLGTVLDHRWRHSTSYPTPPTERTSYQEKANINRKGPATLTRSSFRIQTLPFVLADNDCNKVISLYLFPFVLFPISDV